MTDLGSYFLLTHALLWPTAPHACYPIVHNLSWCETMVCRWWVQPPPGGGALLMPCVALCVSGWSLIHHTVPRSGCRKICRHGISFSDEDIWGFKNPKAVGFFSLGVIPQEMRTACCFFAESMYLNTHLWQSALSDVTEGIDTKMTCLLKNLLRSLGSPTPAFCNFYWLEAVNTGLNKLFSQRCCEGFWMDHGVKKQILNRARSVDFFFPFFWLGS